MERVKTFMDVEVCRSVCVRCMRSTEAKRQGGGGGGGGGGIFSSVRWPQTLFFFQGAYTCSKGTKGRRDAKRGGTRRATHAPSSLPCTHNRRSCRRLEREGTQDTLEGWGKFLRVRDKVGRPHLANCKSSFTLSLFCSLQTGPPPCTGTQWLASSYAAAPASPPSLRLTAPVMTATGQRLPRRHRPQRRSLP